MHSRKCLLLLVAVIAVIPACATHRVAEQPAVIHANAHSGGSIVTFSQSGEVLASGGWEGEVRLWQASGNQQLSHWRAHTDSVNGIGFSADDRRIITAGYDTVLAEWDVQGRLVRKHVTPSPITHMIVSNPAGRIVTGHADGVVRLWQLDLQLLDERQLHNGAVKAVAYSPVSRHYASSGTDGAVYTFLETGTAQQLESPPVDSWTLAFSSDGQTLYGGGWFRLFRWDLPSASLTVLSTRHQGIIKSVQYLDGRNELATISRQTDSSVYFLDPLSGEVTREFQQHDLCGADIAVSADGRYLGTTSDDASARIWHLQQPVST